MNTLGVDRANNQGNPAAFARHIALAAGVAIVSGCNGISLPAGLSNIGTQRGSTEVRAAATTVGCAALAARGPVRAPDTFGNGPTRVAMLVPLSAPGVTGELARDLRNAAALAVNESAAQRISVVVRDTCADPAAAARAAEQVIAQGARVIVGPLRRETVAGVARIAAGAGVPVLGFSSDTGVAGQGVFLMSLLPQNSIDRVLRYAYGQKARRFAAILPAGRYGELAATQMRTTLNRLGGSIEALAEYGAASGDLQRAISRVVNLVRAGGGVDAILVPDIADKAVAIAQALRAGGIDTTKTRLLGSSQWTGATALRNGALDGAWYAAFGARGFDNFAARYRQAFGSRPLRNAAFAYDATLLAAAISEGGRLTPNYRQMLTTERGFNGVDGIFRLKASGANERGLAIYRAAPAGATVIDNAPTSFPTAHSGSLAGSLLDGAAMATQ